LAAFDAVGSVVCPPTGPPDPGCALPTAWPVEAPAPGGTAAPLGPAVFPAWPSCCAESPSDCA